MICDDRLRIGGGQYSSLEQQSGKSDIESFSFILQVNVCADLFHDESPWIVCLCRVIWSVARERALSSSSSRVGDGKQSETE